MDLTFSSDEDDIEVIEKPFNWEEIAGAGKPEEGGVRDRKEKGKLREHEVLDDEEDEGEEEGEEEEKEEGDDEEEEECVPDFELGYDSDDIHLKKLFKNSKPLEPTPTPVSRTSNMNAPSGMSIRKYNATPLPAAGRSSVQLPTPQSSHRSSVPIPTSSKRMGVLSLSINTNKTGNALSQARAPSPTRVNPTRQARGSRLRRLQQSSPLPLPGSDLKRTRKESPLRSDDSFHLTPRPAKQLKQRPPTQAAPPSQRPAHQASQRPATQRLAPTASQRPSTQTSHRPTSSQRPPTGQVHPEPATTRVKRPSADELEFEEMLLHVKKKEQDAKVAQVMADSAVLEAEAAKWELKKRKIVGRSWTACGVNNLKN